MHATTTLRLCCINSAARPTWPGRSGRRRRHGVGPAVAAAARRGWVRMIRSRLRTKLIVVLIALVLATGATFLSTVLSAPLPDYAGEFGVVVSAGLRPRSGLHCRRRATDDRANPLGPVAGIRDRHLQRQQLHRDHSWAARKADNAPPDSPKGGQPRIEVSAPDRAIANGGFIRNVAFESLPVSIPPHQYRLLRITWISDVCMLGGTKSSNMLNDGYTSIDSIYLRVRVGWFTRTDVAAWPSSWRLRGPRTSRVREGTRSRDRLVGARPV